MIKRYSIEGELIYPKDDGHIVRYDDYEILQQKFDGVSRLCEEAMRINCDWEKAMMAAIGEDGIGSVTKAIEQLKADKQALQQKLDEMAAENAALKDFGDKLNDMYNNLNGEGTGIQGRAEVACQQAALEAAIEEFDTIKTPATDAYLNSVRAESWADALFMVKSAIFTDSLDHIDFLFNGKIEQLRSGTHDAAEKAG